MAVQLNAGTAALTAMGGSAVGDQAGDALSQILIWGIGMCTVTPIPTGVVSAFHTLCVLVATGIAIAAHTYFARRQDN